MPRRTDYADERARLAATSAPRGAQPLNQRGYWPFGRADSRLLSEKGKATGDNARFEMIDGFRERRHGFGTNYPTRVGCGRVRFVGCGQWR